MRIKELLILGGGGHARVVCDAVELLYSEIILQIRDDNPELQGKLIGQIPVSTPIGELGDAPCYAHVAIGNNQVRQRLVEFLLANSRELFSIVHQRAIVSQHAKIMSGCFIAAQAVVAPAAVINQACIINHAAIVDHDCQVGAYTHIAPNATLGGGVCIGERCLIGAGAIILPGIQIGNDVTVGAGAVVTKPVKAGSVVTGVPARLRVEKC